MKVLVVKMSSMGDIIHTLPAISDANRAVGATFDWVVEPGFKQIPGWHPFVHTIIEAPLRALRKKPIKAWWGGELGQIKKKIQEREYDLIIDAQGLLKSALVTRWAKGRKVGLNKTSAREPMSAKFYDEKIHVEKGHAVQRVRMLFAKALGYDLNDLRLDYGIDVRRLEAAPNYPKGVIFLHGTTWETKFWPQSHWCQLAQTLSQKGIPVLLPHASNEELERAKQIQASVVGANKPIVMDAMTLSQIASLMSQSMGVVAVDTGLGHLAAALEVPCLSLYGATDAKLTGTHGHHQVHMQSTFACSPCLKRTCQNEQEGLDYPPCYLSLHPQNVFETLQPMIMHDKTA